MVPSNILEWSQIRMTLKIWDRKAKAHKNRILLENIKGKISSCQLLAIMGPTGCGKTSFMNVLAGKVIYNKNIILEGNIVFNGELLKNGLSSKSIGYVAQDETSFAFLTVRETLTLSAYFHVQEKSKEEQRILVDKVIHELSLMKAADTILGDENHRGISGGEYRRVLIGKELIKNPNVVFLDEPTSGLDAHQALSVMTTLKELVQTGPIVINVIHQPRSSIFALLDQLLLLSDGKLMYFGSASDALEYFNNLGYNCPTHFNPADYFLDILSIETKTADEEIASRQRIHNFAVEWQIHSDRETLPVPKPQITANHKEINEKDNYNRDQYALNASMSWLMDFVVLLQRSFKNIYRNYSGLIVRTITTLFFAILVSLIYRDLSNDQKSIQNRVGLLYFILINQGFSPLIVTLNTIPPEKQITNREVSGGSYRYSSYYLGRVIAELPNQIILTIIYSTIIYWSTGLYPVVERFFLFLVLLLLTTLNACSLGFLVSSISPSVDIANAIGPPVFIILLLYGGFYINSSSLPLGSVWVRYLSLVYWGFQALIINEFSGQTFQCSGSIPSGACITTGQQEITALSFENASIAKSCGVLIALTIGFLILGYIGLVFSQQSYCRIQHVPVDSLENEKVVLYEKFNAQSETKMKELEEGELKEDEKHKHSRNSSDSYNHEFQWIYSNPNTADDFFLNTVPSTAKYSNATRFVS